MNGASGDGEGGGAYLYAEALCRIFSAHGTRLVLPYGNALRCRYLRVMANADVRGCGRVVITYHLWTVASACAYAAQLLPRTCLFLLGVFTLLPRTRAACHTVAMVTAAASAFAHARSQRLGWWTWVNGAARLSRTQWRARLITRSAGAADAGLRA